MDEIFPATRNSLLGRAIEGDMEALSILVGRYRPAIEVLVHGRGFGRPDKGPEDLVSEILAEICTPTRIQAWSADKGRFRQWVCGITRNMINEEFRRHGAKKRGSGFTPLGAEVLETVPSEELGQDEAFDFAWATRTVEMAKDQVRSEWEEKGEGEAFEQLLPSAMDGVYAEKKQRALAQELGRPEGTIAGLVIKLRNAIFDACLIVVSETCGTAKEAKEEFRHLMACLEAASKKRPRN